MPDEAGYSCTRCHACQPSSITVATKLEHRPAIRQGATRAEVCDIAATRHTWSTHQIHRQKTSSMLSKRATHASRVSLGLAIERMASLRRVPTPLQRTSRVERLSCRSGSVREFPDRAEKQVFVQLQQPGRKNTERALKIRELGDVDGECTGHDRVRIALLRTQNGEILKRGRTGMVHGDKCDIAIPGARPEKEDDAPTHSCILPVGNVHVWTQATDLSTTAGNTKQC